MNPLPTIGELGWETAPTFRQTLANQGESIGRALVADFAPPRPYYAIPPQPSGETRQSRQEQPPHRWSTRVTNQRFRNEETLRQGYSNIPDQGVRFDGPHPWDVWVVSDPPDDAVIPDLIKREDGVRGPKARLTVSVCITPELMVMIKVSIVATRPTMNRL